MFRVSYLIALCAVAAMLFTVSCTDDGPGSPANPPGWKPPGGNGGGDGGDNRTDVINGTDIAEGMTLCGLVSDAATGNGIPGVVVSDGFSCTQTDTNGVYQMKKDSRATTVFYSTPSGYEVSRSAVNGLPDFYRDIDIWARVFRQDFKLKVLTGGKESKFTLFCLADPQSYEEVDTGRFKAETMVDVEAEAPKYPNVYAITLGDITDNNRTKVWQAMKEAMSKSDVAFFQTMGNHDHLNESNPSLATDYWKSIENFRKFFGPHNYSFDRGDVHIVAMDNALHGEKEIVNSAEYAAGFYDWQFEWLRQDLSYVPKDKMVILCTHIPFRSGSAGNHSNARYRKKTLELLAQFKEAHLMVGHTHYTANHIHTVNGKSIHEHIQSSVCGQFWHSTFSTDGTPNGYGIYEIDGAHIADWHYKAVGRESGFQARVYDADQTFFHPQMNVNGLQSVRDKYAPYRFAGDPGSDDLPAGSIIINVWNVDDNTKVSLWQNGSKVENLRPFTGRRDLWAAYWFYQVYGCSWSSIPECEHLYSAQIDKNNPFEVRVEDGRGNVYKTTKITTDYDDVKHDFVMKNR
jgi:hypothetical protein